MIPKIIHYCWLSKDPLPHHIQKFVDNWQTVLPDYEFILWNFDRFDIELSTWVKQAFEAKKYAFAADYIRLYALYNYGGIYMDSDVEVIKSFDPFLHLKTMLCLEAYGDRYEMATFGVEKQSPWIKDVLAYYKDRSFINKDGSYDTKVVPSIVADLFKEKNTKIVITKDIKSAQQIEDIGAIPIFTSDFFSPKEYTSGKILKTENTVSIHHFEGSWLPRYVVLEHIFWQKLGVNDPNISKRIIKYARKIKNIFSKK